MYCLTKEQIALVVKDVESEGINFSHLDADLIDHICCDIEQQMDQEISFLDAYEQVKRKFGIRGLRQIQQDTLLLIDKNYRMMKNSTKTIGVLALALMAFGAMFKIMHWPFAGIMLAISFVFLTFVFFPALLYVMYRDVNEKKQLGIYVVAFISGAIFFMGVLFKLMHWPFANYLFMPGLALITYVLIPLVIFLRYNKLKIHKTVFLSGLFSLMIVFTGLIFRMMQWPGARLILDLGAIALVLVFIPLFYLKEVRNAEKLRIDFLFAIVVITYFIVFTFLQSLSGRTGLQELLNFQSKSFMNNALILKEINNRMPDTIPSELAVQLAAQADLLDIELDEIKNNIVQLTFQVSWEEAAVLLKNSAFTEDPESNVNSILPEYDINSPLPKLKEDIELFINLYHTIVTDSLQNKNQISQLFGTGMGFQNPKTGPISWESYYFSNKLPSEVINTLSFWQYQIRLAENNALTALSILSPNN